ncbi:flagellin N-terminal helical domain-containing protein [Enterobacter cloacae]|uniref:flagellin N-terminal helical domain-containing protein n=2 Tax=Enterobacter cloacae TaxID=550 RepID=UPI0021D3C4E6|nr:flagellin [Enterobacter cloacae]MCU6209273.1 flagellin FliC [Enterobacter cloacae]
MAQVINTNALSLMAQNNLNKSQTSLGTAIQRLSSGMRINSAKDDAAGLAISNRFTSSIRGMTQAARNANDGISLAQTTEGALEEVTENMQRIRELTVQAKNGTNSASDLESIKKEIGTRLEEISRVAETTNFNGVKVFDGSKDKITIQIGDKDDDTIDITLSKLDMQTLGLDTFMDDFAKIGIPGAGSRYDSAATLAGVGADTGIDTGATGNWKVDAGDAALLQTAIGAAQQTDVEIYTHDGEAFAYDKTADKLFKLDTAAMTFVDDGSGTTAKIQTVTAAHAVEVTEPADKDMLLNGPNTLTNPELLKAGGKINGAGGAEFDLDQAKLDSISNQLFGGDAASSKMQIFSVEGGAANTYYAIDDTGAVKTFQLDDATGDVDTASVADARHAEAAFIKGAASNNLLAKLDGAITEIANFRADLGAVQNRFSSIIANLNTNIINTSEARSRIQDADFSVEVSAMSRANILQQAGVSVLAQANQVPQNVLSLLR